MPRWRQDSKTGKLIPIEEWDEEIHGRRRTRTAYREMDSFVSPVDGSVISDRKTLREHNKRNNVVNTAEYGPEYFQRKADERARALKGEHTPQQKLERKREIYETWVKMERENG